MNNDEKVKEMLEKEPVPNELEPENIKKMLDEKAPQKKRGGISVGGRVAAAAAALTVITGGSYAYFSGAKPERTHTEQSAGVVEETTLPQVEQTTELYSQQAYMSGATDYSQIYQLMKKSSDKQKREMRKYKNDMVTFDAVEEIAEESDDVYKSEEAEVNVGAADYSAINSFDDTEDYSESIQEPQTAAAAQSVDETSDYARAQEYEEIDLGSDDDVNYGAQSAIEEAVPEGNNTEETGMGGEEESVSEENPEFSDTHNQEKDVLEADIVKTDGKYIYYISSEINGGGSVLRSAEVRDGKFLSGHSTAVNIETFYENAEYSGSYVEDMYLYNDMIVIIGDTFGDWYDNDTYRSKQVTYAAFYTTGDSPELIDVYYQDGLYHDVRIAPDGNMYLVTDYVSESFDLIKNQDDYDRYIPQCGLSDTCGLIPPEDILLPPENEERTLTYVGYSVIGSIDLNESGSPRAVDTKALADYTGELYASADNFYTASQHGTQTDLTRIAIGSGGIAPAASATIDGYVKDQFSMSEYDGYFRVAVTRDMYEEKNARWWEKLTGDDYSYVVSHSRDNAVYVFDMDMNMVGSVDNFGNNESVKSVSFQGNMAYVVTYEQTDPLFAIDLSDPASPTILDEFKINGYSTYMQQWSDGLLLGFGVNADENAIETGIKMVMFDNSDPENLKEVGFWSLDRDDSNGYSWVSSPAVWERKALLIAPEKNLIGIPVECEIYHDVPFSNGMYETNWEYVNKFMFFSYENGHFIEKGSVSAENNDYYDQYMLNRAMYIGDYVYILSGARFIAADIDTLAITDDLNFNEGDRLKVTEITTDTTTDIITTETTIAETTINEETTVADTTEAQTETTSAIISE